MYRKSFSSFINLPTLIKLTSVIIAALSLMACMMPDVIKDSISQSEQLLREGQLQSHYVRSETLNLHFVGTGDVNKPYIVFIHGTPGDWKVFGPQLASKNLRAKANLISLDRPGWGLSEFTNAFASGSDSSKSQYAIPLKDQAKYIAPLLKKLKTETNQPIILVGHSLGGTLVPQIAIDYPDLVDKVVVIAGDLTNEYLEKQWYNELASWSIIAFFLSGELLQANSEVLALPEDLDALAKAFPTLAVPLIVVQGDSDSLVDPRNADYAEKLNLAVPVTVHRLEADHIVQLTHPEQVIKILLSLLDN